MAPRNLQADVIREIHDALQIGMPKILAAMINQSLQELPKVIRTMGQALEVKAIPKNRLRATNIEIAELAHQAVVRGWRSRLPANTPPGGSAKHLSGHLGRALANPGMTQYTTDRYVSFINTDILDTEAEHWYRVNYGAAGTRYSEGPSAGRFVVQLNTVAIGSFKDDLPPDSRSWIPKVFVYHSDGSLFPKSTEVVPSPAGARPARFFELGHATVAREAPKKYEELWRKYAGEQSKKAMERIGSRDHTVVSQFRFERTSWDARVRRG